MGQIQSQRRSTRAAKGETMGQAKTDDGVLGLSERIVTIGVGLDDFEIPENPGLPLDELTGSGDGGKDPN